MELSVWFASHEKAAIAFSGGADSAYLLYAAINSGVKVRAYHVRSAFQPQFETDDALRMAKLLSADMTVVEVDVLCSSEITDNPQNRCYFCKKHIFSAVAQRAAQDGFDTVLDGTNASDEADDRPGMKALGELKVLSPLRECGLTKDDIRTLSRQAGLFTWDKPAYACLATRIPTGEKITAEKLKNTELAENFLFSLGFTDFRVRSVGNAAKIQVPVSQLESVMKNRLMIIKELKQYYGAVTLDLEARDE